MTPYEVYFYSSGAVEERWSPKDLGINRANAIVGYGLGGLLSLSLMIVGGDALPAARASTPELPRHDRRSGRRAPLGQFGLLLALVGILVRGRRRGDRHRLLRRLQPRPVLRLGVGQLPAAARGAALHAHVVVLLVLALRDRR